MARYATWRKHREQRARAIQQAIFMPTKRGSRAIARYARVSEATCVCACVCTPGPSSSKEWLSSRPIDRLESKITRFLAAHSQARSRVIVPDGASCRGRRLFSSLFSLLFFFLLKRKRAATSPFFYSVPYVHRMFQLARRNINAGLILFEVRSPENLRECLCFISVAKRLTRKRFRLPWYTIFDITELVSKSYEKAAVAVWMNFKNDFDDNNAYNNFFLNACGSRKCFTRCFSLIIVNLSLPPDFIRRSSCILELHGIYNIKTPISVFLHATAHFVFDQCATYSGPALHLHSRQIQFPRNKADVPKRPVAMKGSRFSLSQKRCR